MSLSYITDKPIIKDWHQVGITLGSMKCSICHGYGMILRSGKEKPCRCVFRAVFNSCLRTYWKIIAKYPGCLQYIEFIADFTNTSIKNLNIRDSKIFTLHYLNNFDWKVCCARLKLSRGYFFRRCDQIREKLGKIFFELRPYSLFPPGNYFNVVRRVS